MHPGSLTPPLTDQERALVQGMPEPVALGFIQARRKAEGQPRGWDDMADDGQRLLNLIFGKDFTVEGDD